MKKQSHGSPLRRSAGFSSGARALSEPRRTTMSAPMFGWSSFGSATVRARWGTDFAQVAESLGRVLGLSFSHLGFTYSDKARAPVTYEGKTIPGSKSKTWKYSGRALERFLKVSGEEDLRSVEFVQAGPDGNLNLGVRAVLSCRQQSYRAEIYYQTSLVAELSSIGVHSSPNSVAKAILLAFEDVLHQEYARVDCQNRSRIFPFVYNDFGHEPEIGEDQTALVTVFGEADRYGRQFRTKLRGFHWGNLLSEHGGKGRGALWDDIMSAVGEENMFAPDGKRLFFCLPFDPRDVKGHDRNIELWRSRFRHDLARFEIFL
jgi:hypothetical protein